MKRRRWIAPAGAALVAGLMHPAWSLATEAAHGEGHAPGIGDLLFPAINFTIFAFIVAKYVVPALRELSAPAR